MLFSFPTIDDPILQFNDHLIYFFRQMFKLEPKKFDKDLFQSEIHPILKKSKKFKDHLKIVVREYSKLNMWQKADIEKAFSSNTSTCVYYDSSIELVKYDQLPKNISDALRELFDFLWEKFFKLKCFKKVFGGVKSHYNKITDKIQICPFCGINPIIPTQSAKREDYDHIIPQAQYPFISVNFAFIAPACKHCNVTEKSTDDIAYNDEKRRRFYNPYDPTVSYDDLSINIDPKEDFNTDDISCLLKSIDWDYQINRNDREQEELTTWNEVYRIKGRYHEFCQSYEKQWFDEIKREYKSLSPYIKDFNIIRSKLRGDVEYLSTISPLGVIKQSYFNYILTLEDIEERLNFAIGLPTLTTGPAN